MQENYFRTIEKRDFTDDIEVWEGIHVLLKIFIWA